MQDTKTRLFSKIFHNEGPTCKKQEKVKSDPYPFYSSTCRVPTPPIYIALPKLIRSQFRYAKKIPPISLKQKRIESECCLPPHSGRWFRRRCRRRRRTSPLAARPRRGGVRRRRWWCARCGTTTPSQSGSPSAPAAASSTSSSGRTSPSSSAPRTRSQVRRRSSAGRTALASLLPDLFFSEYFFYACHMRRPATVFLV